MVCEYDEETLTMKWRPKNSSDIIKKNPKKNKNSKQGKGPQKNRK